MLSHCIRVRKGPFLSLPLSTAFAKANRHSAVGLPVLPELGRLVVLAPNGVGAVVCFISVLPANCAKRFGVRRSWAIDQ
jgi:hypothetical protein